MANNVISIGNVDVVGAARSNNDRAAARLAGFAPKDPLYTVGTRVVELGVENARASRVEHDAKPLTADACRAFARRIAGEERVDHAVTAGAIRMTSDGRIGVPGSQHLYSIERDALASLATRLGYGGGDYLAKCRPELRARNVNDWGEQIAAGATEVDPTTKVNLRTRKGADGSRSCYAATSVGYTAFDVDATAAAVATVAPQGSRGSIQYDGTRAKIEAIYHSDVQPEKYVAGEFFKAGIEVGTDDTGGGSITITAKAWQNLCLNLIVIDVATVKIDRIRHVGSLAEVERRIRAGVARATGRIAHFMKAWSGACADDIRSAEHRALSSTTIDRRILAGYFAGAAKQWDIPVGRVDLAIPLLVAAFKADHSSATLQGGLSRAALANAFTRFAHTAPLSNVWAEGDIERAAGVLVQSSAPVQFVENVLS